MLWRLRSSCTRSAVCRQARRRTDAAADKRLGDLRTGHHGRHLPDIVDRRLFKGARVVAHAAQRHGEFARRPALPHQRHLGAGRGATDVHHDVIERGA
jgi:hypothetical protein